jgi:hypothetical protein
MVDPYTRAYWKGLERNWKDEVMASVFASLRLPAQREKYAILAGQEPRAIEAVFATALAQGDGMFLGDATPLDAFYSDAYLQVEEAATKYGLAPRKRPLLGTLPTSRVNAQVVLVERTGDLILAFEAGLLPSIWYMGNLLAATLQPDEQGKLLSFSPVSADVRREAIAWGAKVIANYLFSGSPLISQPLKLDRNQQPLSRLLSGFMTHFVVGHEFAHLALDHLVGGQVTRFSMAGSVACATVEVRDRECEYEADKVGLVLGVSSWLFRRKVPYLFSAPLSVFFLRFVETVHRAIELITASPFSDEEHPPISDRIDVVIAAAISLVGEERIAEYEAWSTLVTGIADELRDFTLPFIEALVRDGCRLSPLWSGASKQFAMSDRSH